MHHGRVKLRWLCGNSSTSLLISVHWECCNEMALLPVHWGELLQFSLPCEFVQFLHRLFSAPHYHRFVSCTCSSLTDMYWDWFDNLALLNVFQWSQISRALWFTKPAGMLVLNAM
jgi:hypothetical protein